MLKMFKTEARPHTAAIVPVDVIRETERCVFVPANGAWHRGKTERREAKVSEWHIYHATWEAAHEHLTQKSAGRVADARRSLELANAFAGNVKGMRKPVEGAEA